MSKFYETGEGSSEQDTPVQSLQINTFAFVGLQLRVATSRFSRVNIDQKVLQELKDSCKMYLNACSLLLGSVSPTVWTIGHAVPFHTELLFNNEKKHIMLLAVLIFFRNYATF